ncbi:MAG: hypothetical protein KatS3mg109_0710 [Pirellulaceae bacterium]|nr:MAG: hypothetical protein KatS3mg109_0710 [Pirellulaceae bacterium]
MDQVATFQWTQWTNSRLSVNPEPRVWDLSRRGRVARESVLGNAMTKPPRNNGARHYGPRAKYGARQYGSPPKNEVPGTTLFPAGPRTDTTPIADHAIRQYRYFPGTCSPRQPQYRSEKPQQEAQKTNYWVLQATTDKTLTPQPASGC